MLWGTCWWSPSPLCPVTRVVFLKTAGCPNVLSLVVSTSQWCRKTTVINLKDLLTSLKLASKTFYQETHDSTGNPVSSLLISDADLLSFPLFSLLKFLQKWSKAVSVRCSRRWTRYLVNKCPNPQQSIIPVMMEIKPLCHAAGRDKKNNDNNIATNIFCSHSYILWLTTLLSLYFVELLKPDFIILLTSCNFLLLASCVTVSVVLGNLPLNQFNVLLALIPMTVFSC